MQIEPRWTLRALVGVPPAGAACPETEPALPLPVLLSRGLAGLGSSSEESGHAAPANRARFFAWTRVSGRALAASEAQAIFRRTHFGNIPRDVESSMDTDADRPSALGTGIAPPRTNSHKEGTRV